MTFLEQASILRQEEIAALLELNANQRNQIQDQNNQFQKSQKSISGLAEQVQSLTEQLNWFKQQLFGEKSERRFDTYEDQRQLWLGDAFAEAPTGEAEKVVVKSHEKKKRSKEALDGAVEEIGLRFDGTVPVRVVNIKNPEIEGLSAEDYEVVSEKTTHRLAQRPSSYEVIKYVRTLVKLKADSQLSCSPAPQSVLEKSFADVSLLAGLVVDKFVYHLPLHRQHQRMEQSGVKVSRATLTNYVHRSAELLKPVYEALISSIRSSKVLIMDETPIKAGLAHSDSGTSKMQRCYFWPIYGDQDEVAFPFFASRSGIAAREVLGDFQGVLLTDGYKVYERFSEMTKGVVHAQCWVHTRRNFVKAEAVEPELARIALGFIGELYQHEKTIKERKLDSEKKQNYRAMHSKPIVDKFFCWLAETYLKHSLLPSSPFTKAANYALEREEALKVFLQFPDVYLDTNEVERQIRPVAVGRKNYMFCWTEIGAEYAGILYSLVSSCRIQGINPYTYLVDVLQRVATHPQSKVEQLIPRMWKTHFADDTLVSDLQKFHSENPGLPAI